ncbi:IclR family transcriptional regulator C-terminal domain-containing protein, partial [Nocardia puris]
RPLRRLTPATVTHPQALTDTLAGVRTAGLAVDLGETVSEVHCVAAPVRDDLGSVVAAVSMSVPATRFAQRRAQLERGVVGAAHEITRAIADAHDRGPLALRDDPAAGFAPVRRAG